MAKTALLAQNDNLAIDSLKSEVGRSTFDLSHTTTFPINPDGAILPICCIETVPSDSFQISNECLLRQITPMVVPQMVNYRLNTAYFWCSNRLAWKKWDRFMSGGRSGDETYDIPRVANSVTLKNSDGSSIGFVDYQKGMEANARITFSNSIHTYFGIRSGQSLVYQNGNWLLNGAPLPDDYDASENPVAFPFFDYQLICRDFYTDVDRLPDKPNATNTSYPSLPFNDWAYSNLFPSDDDEIRLNDGIQIRSGFFSGDDDSLDWHGFYLDKVRYHNVRDDYFTTSKKSPMRGEAPSIQVLTSNLAIPTGTRFNITDVVAGTSSPVSTELLHKGLHLRTADSDNDIIESNYGIVSNDNGNSSSISLRNSAIVNKAVVADLNDLQYVNGTLSDDVSVNGILSAGINAAELRLLSQLTVWKELNMLRKPYYNDFLNAHFNGIKVGDTIVEKPQYIGGTSQVVSINEIIQTSQSSDTSPLGNVGATSFSLNSGRVGTYFCQDYGYIIGVAYIIPDMYYEPAMPRHFSRRTKEDYYSPEFANLSMQAILNKEVFMSSNKEWNNGVFGYSGAFDELRSIPNRIAGDLLNDDYSDLQAWVLRRHFDDDHKPSMSTEFLSLHDNVDYTAFAAPSMPKFMLQCANYIKAVRPMPYVAIPKAL